MTMLALPDGRLEVCAQQAGGAISLRAWLADRWAVLFSHPEDFVQEQLEMDRWISVLSRSFSGRGVAPVALARPGHDPGESWLGRLAARDDESAAVLALDPPLPDTLTDISAGALRADIARSGPRFAMIIDANLRCRRALRYRPPAELPSPLDLIGWAVALRKREHAGEGRREAPEPSLPIRPGGVTNARYAVAQAGRA